MSKPKIIKDYEKLTEEIQNQLKLMYPNGFKKDLILFPNAKGMFVSALPFETDEYYYLIRMTKKEANEIIEEDDDYDEDGNLKEEFIEELKNEQDS